MKNLNHGTVVVLFLCFLMAPMGHSSVALSSNTELLDGFTAFPKPNEKPSYVCNEQEGQINETYLGQKQAAAAALGLYFGVRHANAPQLKKENLTQYICL